jgi:CPA1 family monovalent cation:H+ antiporter
MDVPSTVLVIAGFLLLVSLAEPLATRLRVPATVVLALLGVVIAVTAAQVADADPHGAAGHMADTVLDFPMGSEAFLLVFLPILLFQAALATNVRDLAEDAVPILTLAILAVVLATFAIGAALYPFAGVALSACLLLGAIVATTDPSAVIGIFREAGAPKRLTKLVEGESLLNDAAAVTFFAIFMQQLSTGIVYEIGPAMRELILLPIAGGVLGYLGGTACAGLMRLVRDNRLLIVSITLAVPLALMSFSNEIGVSGFVAVVAAGITMAAKGPPRSSPESWQYVQDVWEQLSYWASSLLFIFAALLIPDLLQGLGLRDLAMLAIMVVAALVSRIVVLYAVLPALTAFNLSPRVSPPYRLVILWGGLRGAATLALALAVTESPAIDPETKRFVGIMATGFVLFTLFVQGTTLRPFMRWLGLDRLTPLESALHNQALALVANTVRSRIAKAAVIFQVPQETAEAVTALHLSRLSPRDVSADTEALAEISLDDRTSLALAAMAAQEADLVLDKLAELHIAPQNAARLLANTRRLLDATRDGGRTGYVHAASIITTLPRDLRFAHWLHLRTRYDGALRSRLADRFEVLLASQSIIEDLREFAEEGVTPLFGLEVSTVLREVRSGRAEAVVRELDALRLQFPAYAEALHAKILIRSALRFEEIECQRLYEDGLIGHDVYRKLLAEISAARIEARRRPMLDLRLDRRELARSFPFFDGFDDVQLAAVTKFLHPRTAIPGQEIIRRGERGDTCYFIASGAVEVETGFATIRLGRGDVFGEMALLTGLPRQADVTAIAYCSLLELTQRDFNGFLGSHPSLREHVERLTRARLDANAAFSGVGETDCPGAGMAAE